MPADWQRTWMDFPWILQARITQIFWISLKRRLLLPHIRFAPQQGFHELDKQVRTGTETGPALWIISAAKDLA